MQRRHLAGYLFAACGLGLALVTAYAPPRPTTAPQAGAREAERTMGQTKHNGTDAPLTFSNGAGGHVAIKAAQPAEWTVSGDGTNAGFTSTRDAVPGKRHYITAIYAEIRDTSMVQNDVVVTLKSGTTSKWPFSVHAAAEQLGYTHLPFGDAPLELGEGEAANLVVSAAAGAATIRTCLAGFTR